MKRFTPSYIAPKRPLTIDDLKKRGFGEALYTKLTPQQRQGVIMLGVQKMLKILRFIKS